MHFYVEHTHKGNVDLNVNITVKSESPIEKEPVRKEEENPPKSFHAIIATLYLGISSSLIADPLKNLISNSGVPGWYNFIMLYPLAKVISKPGTESVLEFANAVEPEPDEEAETDEQIEPKEEETESIE